MPEIKFNRGWKVLQEFSDGPTLMCLAYAFQKSVRKESGSEIYCVLRAGFFYKIVSCLVRIKNFFFFKKNEKIDQNKRKVFFQVVSRFRVVKGKNLKGAEARTVEVDVIRSKDNRRGTLVFIEGHRQATFFEKNTEKVEEAVTQIEAIA